MTRTIDFEQFAAEQGAPASFGDAGLHRSAVGVPESTRQRHIAQQAEKDTALLVRRDALRAEYDHLVAADILRPLTHRERLERTAAGHDDNASVRAARRLLRKYDAN